MRTYTGKPTVTDCTFIDNFAGTAGGALYSAALVDIERSTICGNTSPQISGTFQDSGNNCIEPLCIDCIDNCPDDPNKTEPGICGCGVPDSDLNENGTPDCLDCSDPSDIDQNNEVNGADLSILLSLWGTEVAVADLNGDGVIDGFDLAQILAQWGPCNR